ncbi:hypothetical protein [Nonomuraea sp. NPDC050202]|uniref:hypothetical protein n=1 Tax=Nonomuraea sp. NPDC050202 TaxID=3155035 RepID=UPI0033D7CAB1
MGQAAQAFARVDGRLQREQKGRHRPVEVGQIAFRVAPGPQGLGEEPEEGLPGRVTRREQPGGLLHEGDRRVQVRPVAGDVVARLDGQRVVAQVPGVAAGGRGRLVAGALEVLDRAEQVVVRAAHLVAGEAHAAREVGRGQVISGEDVGAAGRLLQQVDGEIHVARRAGDVEAPLQALGELQPEGQGVGGSRDGLPLDLDRPVDVRPGPGHVVALGEGVAKDVQQGRALVMTGMNARQRLLQHLHGPIEVGGLARVRGPFAQAAGQVQPGGQRLGRPGVGQADRSARGGDLPAHVGRLLVGCASRQARVELGPPVYGVGELDEQSGEPGVVAGGEEDRLAQGFDGLLQAGEVSGGAVAVVGVSPGRAPLPPAR